jgi:uncharacterized protein (DUF1330 family)
MRFTLPLLSSALLGLMTAPTQAETGLLILSPQPISLPQQTPLSLDALGCSVWRHGQIGGSRGELSLGEATHFALASCESDQTSTAEDRAALRFGLGLPDNAVLLEGAYRNTEMNPASMIETPERYYVLKIGTFNNTDPDARQAGHADFMATAAQRPHAFTIAATINVEWATGMSTPDTVEVFYYRDYAEGRAFATVNDDIVSASDAFNAAHFDAYVYFAGLTPDARAPQTRLEAGSVLSYTLAAPSETGVQARNGFAQFDAMAAAERASGPRFDVRSTILGDFEPDSVQLHVWPSQHAADAYETYERRPLLERFASQGWTGRRVYSAVLEDDLDLTLDPDKFYTLALAWFDPENPTDYARYLDMVAEDLAAVGGRFVYKMYNPDAHLTRETLDAPDQITLAEWDSIESLRALRSLPQYQAAAPYLDSGTRYFEFYSLNLTPPSQGVTAP